MEWSAPGERGQQPSAEDLERLAHWMDTLFEIPGLRLRVGLDALLGLVPGVGDTAAAFTSIYILKAATNIGVSRVTIARMTLNIAIDLVMGVIPIIGDIFDAYWKTNRRNVALLRRYLQTDAQGQRKLRRGDSLFVAGMIALICAILIGSLVGAYFILAWVIGSVSRLAS